MKMNQSNNKTIWAKLCQHLLLSFLQRTIYNRLLFLPANVQSLKKTCSCYTLNHRQIYVKSKHGISPTSFWVLTAIERSLRAPTAVKSITEAVDEQAVRLGEKIDPALTGEWCCSAGARLCTDRERHNLLLDLLTRRALSDFTASSTSSHMSLTISPLFLFFFTYSLSHNLFFWEDTVALLYHPPPL